MPKIIFLPHEELCPDGAVVEADKGESVLNVALKNEIGIEHACEKVCAVLLVTSLFVKALTLLKKVTSSKMICLIKRGD